MREKFTIVDTEFISYYGGYAHIISNGEYKIRLFHDEIESQQICDKLNEFRTKISKLTLENTSLIMLNQEMCNVVDICINLMEECNLKNMKELQDVVREACTSKNKVDNEKV